MKDTCHKMLEDRKIMVEKTFSGLSDFIKDKEILDWYKSLIVDAIDVYVTQACADIADEQSIKFAEWVGRENYLITSFYLLGEWRRMGGEIITTEQLLQKFKEETE